MLQKLPANKLEWIEYISQFNKDFIKKYNEKSGEGCFLQVDVQYHTKLHKLQNGLSFLS